MWRQEVGITEMLFTYIGDYQAFSTWTDWRTVMIDILNCHEEVRRQRLVSACSSIEANETNKTSPHQSRLFRRFTKSVKDVERYPKAGGRDIATTSDDWSGIENPIQKDGFSMLEEKSVEEVKKEPDYISVTENINEAEANSTWPFSDQSKTEATQMNVDIKEDNCPVQRRSVNDQMHLSPVTSAGVSWTHNNQENTLPHSQSMKSTSNQEIQQHQTSCISTQSYLKYSSDDILIVDVGNDISDPSLIGPQSVNVSEHSHDFIGPQSEEITFDKVPVDIGYEVQKPFSCSFCPKSFSSRSSKKSHEMTHTGERPFPCRYCQKTFIHLSHRKAHERVHTGEKPYVCRFCGKTFNQNSNRVTHERIHLTPHDSHS